jgi:hypothetical protein
VGLLEVAFWGRLIWDHPQIVAFLGTVAGRGARGSHGRVDGRNEKIMSHHEIVLLLVFLVVGDICKFDVYACLHLTYRPSHGCTRC